MDGFNDTTVVNNVTKEDEKTSILKVEVSQTATLQGDYHLQVSYTGQSSVTVTAHKDFLVDKVRVREGMNYAMGDPLFAFVSMGTDETEMEDCTHSHVTYSVPLSELWIYIKNLTKEDDKPLPSSKDFVVYTVSFDCIVTEVLVEKGTQVRKGQALFVLEPVEVKVCSSNDPHVDAPVNKKRKVSYTGESSVTVTAHKDFVVDKVRVQEAMKYVNGYPLFAFVSMETDATEMEACAHLHVTYSVPYSELGIFNKNVTKEDDKPLQSSKACIVYTVPFDCIVTNVLVRKGTKVRKGQALFVLEPEEIKEEDILHISERHVY